SAIWGSTALWLGSESLTGDEKDPPPGRKAVSITKWVPSERRQTAIASPSESSATRGDRASSPFSESCTGLENAPPAGREVASTMRLVPSERLHPATASPAGSSATSGSPASSPAAERLVGESHTGAAKARELPSTMIPSAPNRTSQAMRDPAPARRERLMAENTSAPRLGFTPLRVAASD